jgi:hypothetical protein
MATQRIKLVVINENTLGYLIPGSNYAGVLHASVLRGSHLNPLLNHDVRGANIRLASEQDFNDYRVSFRGFENPEEYEYAQS